MSFCDAAAKRQRARSGAALSGLLGLVLLAGCQAGPLYGAGAETIGQAVAPGGQLAALRGRIAVSEADTRTAQLVRNELLLRLDQGVRVADPLYRVKLDVVGFEVGVSIESGGDRRSSVYRMTGRYQLVRVADNTVLEKGSRFVIVPFDRTLQLFQSQRALLNARQEAAKALADQLTVQIGKALQTPEAR